MNVGLTAHTCRWPAAIGDAGQPVTPHPSPYTPVPIAPDRHTPADQDGHPIVGCREWGQWYGAGVAVSGRSVWPCASLSPEGRSRRRWASGGEAVADAAASADTTDPVPAAEQLSRAEAGWRCGPEGLDYMRRQAGAGLLRAAADRCAARAAGYPQGPAVSIDRAGVLAGRRSGVEDRVRGWPGHGPGAVRAGRRRARTRVRSAGHRRDGAGRGGGEGAACGGFPGISWWAGSRSGCLRPLLHRDPTAWVWSLKGGVRQVKVVGLTLAVLGYATALVMSWLRSRSLAECERIRGECLVDLVRVLPGGGQVCERRVDGSSLSLVAPVRRNHLGEERHG